MNLELITRAAHQGLLSLRQRKMDEHSPKKFFGNFGVRPLKDPRMTARAVTAAAALASM